MTLRVSGGCGPGACRRVETGVVQTVDGASRNARLSDDRTSRAVGSQHGITRVAWATATAAEQVRSPAPTRGVHHRRAHQTRSSVPSGEACPLSAMLLSTISAHSSSSNGLFSERRREANVRFASSESCLSTVGAFGASTGAASAPPDLGGASGVNSPESRRESPGTWRRARSVQRRACAGGGARQGHAGWEAAHVLVDEDFVLHLDLGDLVQLGGRALVGRRRRLLRR